MDRARCFSILGLSENATKEQVKRAYDRKLATYKGPNYADEPAYAERKMAQLHQAYEEAYALADNDANSNTASRIERDVQQLPKKKTAKSSHLLDAERDAEDSNKREKFHQWLERRDDKKQSRKDGKRKELPKLQKPDLSKLKNKLSEIRDEVASQLDFDGEENGEFFGQEPFVNEIETNKDDFSDFVKECVYTEEKTEPGRGFSDTGSSLDEDTTVEYSGENTRTAKASKGLSTELIKLIVSIIVIIVAAAGGCSDDVADDEDYDYDGDGFAYIFDIAQEEIRDEDRKVVNLADESYILLLDQEERSFSSVDYVIQDGDAERADQFAENYWGKESMTEVLDDLYQEYGEAMDYSSDSLDVQLDAVFEFYGFATLDMAAWYEQPYTGDYIECYGDYLDYLNQFYEAQ